ncbi:hypothetical protein IAR55_000416 [Kwoniella newhampshirensis]|uniref:Kinesin motor domain-containing protein n=1 Tax=Kwoniella newhampshirensis TaxID=1651941 RepID=A0AAW0Z6P2_9TREE
MSKAIACHVRVRPPAPDGNDCKINDEDIKIEGNKISALNSQGDKRYHFEFEKCHDVNSTQEEVFDSIAPFIEQAYQGINCTIFAYGVTGSGKTHTMQGDEEDPGIIPRIVNAVFQKRSQLKKSTLSLSFSYVEILKDEVYDLLGSLGHYQPRKRDIRTSSDGQNIVADLVVHPVESEEQFTVQYDAAAKTRKTASTKLNSSSSRSHAILTLHIEIRNNEYPNQVRSGKICLTDLAGSENNNLTGNDRERMRESAAINTSLTTLGKIVDALNLKAQRGRADSTVFVPYRESKLTRLLQDALEGHSQNLLICCLAPGEKFARDTINTLQFAKKSTAVENRLQVDGNGSRRLSQVPARRLSGPPSRRPSQVPPPHAPRCDRLIPFRIHTDPNVPFMGRPSLGRPVLSALAPNIKPVRTAGNRTAGGKNRGKADKENMASGTSEGKLDRRKVANRKSATVTEKHTQQDDAEKAKEQQAQSDCLSDRLIDQDKQHTGAQEENEAAQNLAQGAQMSLPQAAVFAPAIEPVSGPSPTGDDNVGPDIASLNDEARVNWGKTLVSHARVYHQAGDLERALQLYKRAYDYVPQNHRLERRIFELELSLKGMISPPKLTSTSIRVKEPFKITNDTDVGSMTPNDLKRPRSSSSYERIGVKVTHAGEDDERGAAKRVKEDVQCCASRRLAIHDLVN